MSFKRLTKLICVFVCFSGFIVSHLLIGARAFSGGPDPARTGAPGELTCATGECHGTARSVDLQKFRIEAPATYEPGRTYRITVRHISADLTRLRWGFQLTALTAAGARAGTWQSLGEDTQIVEDNFLRRQYAQHTFAGTFGGQTGGARWTVNWTAPATPTTDAVRVTFYAAGNQADDSRSSFGDLIFTAQAVSEAGQSTPPPMPQVASVPGSLLVFNLVTSQAGNRARQDSRISLTNTHESQAVMLRLLLVDGGSGAMTEAFLRLAPLQTTSVLASDFDPGGTGYLLAMACDEMTGCPISFNHLVGDEYVKLASGHAANLPAESFALSPVVAISCLNGAVTLRFDGLDYNRAPRTLVVANLGSRASGNETLLVVNRFGGDWRTGARPLTSLSGWLYDDAEQAVSVSLAAGNCQFLAALSDQTLRAMPRFSEIVPAARSGWLKLWAAEETALLGAAINSHPQTRANENAFSHGHNLHHLSFAPIAVLTLPVTPPSL
jgi:hypothetical protein